MNKFWNKHLCGIAPYIPGEQPKDKKYIKLNTNECPYPPSPLVIQRIHEYSSDFLRLYPDPETTALREALAETYNLQPHNIFTGNGSDEILGFAFMCFFNRGDKVYFPDITYSFYTVYAALFELKEQSIPLDRDFNIRVSDYSGCDGGIIIANPNAPTGICLSCQEVETILKNNKDHIVILDEAYIDFGGESAVRLIPDYENLLVIHTFSKSRALAGLRLGYALGHENLIRALESVKFSFNSYTINSLSSAAGIAALEDVNYFDRTRSKIIETRNRTQKELKQLGFMVLPSSANFIFASHPAAEGKTLYSNLRKQGILVRHFSKQRIENFIRITVGTDREMDYFLETLKKEIL